MNTHAHWKDINKLGILFQETQDEATFAELYHSLTIFISRFYSKRYPKGSIHVKEEALSMTLISVWEKIHQFNSNKGSFRTWVIRIAMNNYLLNIKRTAQQRAEYPFSNMREGFELGALNSATLIDTPPCIEIEEPELLTMIDTLPEEVRFLFKGKYIDNLKYTELEEMYGIHSSTIKTRVRKGRRLLQALYKKQMYED